MDKELYGENVSGNIMELVDKLKDKSYRPKPTKRVYIPKDNGDKRTLGILSLEDKMVQMALAKIIGAIYEPVFLECMFGFRPGRGCHDALWALNWVIEKRHTFHGEGWLVNFADDFIACFQEKEENSIPGAVILTSRQALFTDEFEPYQIGFLSMEQCKEIYEKIRFRGSAKRVGLEEIQDLEYVIENLVGKHTITVEFLAHLARIKLWTVKRLRKELEQKGFQLAFHKSGELVNIQKSYEVLYDLSQLSEAEQNILEAFSIFPYIPLEAETCNQWLLVDAGVSEDDDILMGLYQKGWMQFEMEQESYALHPVFAQFIYEKCKPKAEKHFRLIHSCEESLEVPESGRIVRKESSDKRENFR